VSKPSELEDALYFQIKVSGLPLPERQHKPIEGRKYAFDFAWPDQKLACEVDGGVWTGGRHSRGSGIETDAEKYSLAAARGWRILRVVGKQVESGAALRWVEMALRYGEEEAG
jgi:very-short-patch-repair endonuclease